MRVYVLSGCTEHRMCFHNLQSCIAVLAPRAEHQSISPMSHLLDKCFLHNLTLHLSVTLLLIRERLNWGKVKMEHSAINWVWFIIHGVQCAVPMDTQHHVPAQHMHCRPKDCISNCWRERILRAFQNAKWMFFLCTETSTPSQKLI